MAMVLTFASRGRGGVRFVVSVALQASRRVLLPVPVYFFSTVGSSSATGDDIKARTHKLLKVDALKAAGQQPYAYTFTKTHSASELQVAYGELPDGQDDASGEAVRFAGRVMTKRVFGKLAFLDIQDGSGKIQLYADRAELGQERFKQLKDWVDVGDFVGVGGTMKKTDKGELSIRVSEWEMLTKALSTLPDKYHGLVDVEKRYRYRHLDMIMNSSVRKVFQTRAAVMRRIRALLDSRGFVEMDTPVLTQHAGGADATPFLTHHNALDMGLALRIATELHLKRLVVGGIDKVYEIGRIFRNEGLSTRHNPEFTSVELYQAYADYTDMMEVTEIIFRDVFESCRDCGEHIQLKGNELRVSYQGTSIDMSFPWRRVSMDSLVLEVTGLDFMTFYSSGDVGAAQQAALTAGVPSSSLEGVETIGEILNLVFEHACEGKIVNPTFVTDHPVEISPLAKSHRERGPAFTERFELFIMGREYANAFSELTDPVDQRQRFEAQVKGRCESGVAGRGLKVIDDEFLHALEVGLPPTGGLGIGIDRLVMLLTDSASIKDVIPFPLLRPNTASHQ